MNDRDRHLSASAIALSPKSGMNGSGTASPQPKKGGLLRRTMSMSFQFGRKKTEQIDPNTMAFIRVRYKDVSKAVIWPEYAGQSIRKPSAIPVSPDKSIIYHSSGNHQPAVTLRLNGKDMPKDIRKSVLKANAVAKQRKPIDAISMSEDGVHTGSSIFYAHAYDITNAAEMQTTNGSTATKPRAVKRQQKTAGDDSVSNASSTSIDPQPPREHERQSPAPQLPNVPPRSVDDYTAGPNPIFQADIDDEKSPYMPAMINSVRRSESESSSDSVVQITRL